MGLRANTLSGMTPKERKIILEEQLAQMNQQPNFELVESDPAAQAAPEPIPEPAPPSDPQQEALDQMTRDQIDNAKLPKNPFKGIASDNLVGALAGTINPETFNISEMILKAAQAEEESLNKLRERIQAYDVKKANEPKQIDFSPMAGLVDTLTGSNTLSYIKPPKEKGDTELESIKLQDALNKRQSELEHRRIKLLEDIHLRAIASGSEEAKYQQRLNEIKLTKDLDLRNDMAISKLKQNAELSKSGTLEGKVKELNASEKEKYSKLLEAYQAADEMESALKKGNNTFSPWGDNDFTAARARYIEYFGRLQSGGQIGADEAEGFKKLVPTALDSSPMQYKKLQSIRDGIRSQISNYGVNPDEAILKRKVQSGGDKGQEQTNLLLKKDPSEMSDEELKAAEDHLRKQGALK